MAQGRGAVGNAPAALGTGARARALVNGAPGGGPSSGARAPAWALLGYFRGIGRAVGEICWVRWAEDPGRAGWARVGSGRDEFATFCGALVVLRYVVRAGRA